MNPQGGNGNVGMAHSGLASLVGTNDPEELQKILQFAKVPAEELRRKGISPEIINKVELHRDLFVRTLEGQENFRDAVKNGANGANGMQPQSQMAMANAMLAGAQQGQGNLGGMSFPIGSMMRQNNGMGLPGSPAPGNPQQQQQQQQQQMQQQQQQLQARAPAGQGFRRPTPETQQRAMKLVHMLREQFKNWSECFSSTSRSRSDLKPVLMRSGRILRTNGP